MQSNQDDPTDQANNAMFMDFPMTRQTTDQHIDVGLERPAGQINPPNLTSPLASDGFALPKFDGLSLSQLARQQTDMNLDADNAQSPNSDFKPSQMAVDDDHKNEMPSLSGLPLSGLTRQCTDVTNPDDSDHDETMNADTGFLGGMTRQQTDATISIPSDLSDLTKNTMTSPHSLDGNEVPNMDPILSNTVSGSLVRRNTTILNREEVLNAMDGMDGDTVGMDNNHNDDDEPVLEPMSLSALTRQQTDQMLAMANAVENAMDIESETGDLIGSAMPKLDAISRQTTDAAKDVDDAMDSNEMMIDQMDSSNAPIQYIPPRVTSQKQSGNKNDDKTKMVQNQYLDPDLVMFDDKGQLLGMDFDENENGDNEAEEEEEDQFEDHSMNQFVEHSDAVHCIAFHPEPATKAMSGGQDDTVFIWDILKYDASAIGVDPANSQNEANNAGGSELQNQSEDGFLKIKDHSDTVIDCGWNKSGKFAATASMDGTVKVYRSNKGMALVSNLEMEGEVTFMRWHPGNEEQKQWRNVLMAGSKDKNVWMYEYNKNEKQFENIQILTGHSGEVECGGFTRFNGGKYVFSGDQDGMIVIWDNVMDSPFGGRKKYAFKPLPHGGGYHESGITVMEDCMAAPLLISGSCDAIVCLINYENGKVIRTLGKHADCIECVGFKNDGSNAQYASSSSIDGVIKVWDLSKGAVRSTFEYAEGVVLHRWFNTPRYSSLIAAGCMDGTVYISDSRNGETVKKFQGHSAAVQTLRISPDDKYVVSGGDDTTVRVWEV